MDNSAKSESNKTLRDEFPIQWMVAHMKKEKFRKGTILFHKGDKADKMYYVNKGTLRLIEINKLIKKGEVIGELGILSPFKERMASAICEDDIELYTVGKDELMTLFNQNPSLALELIQLGIKHLSENLKAETEAKERIESELRIARDIQIHTLPRVFPTFQERKEFDIFASMEPAKEVGGDFYDFFFISENKLCFLIGDVSGKGVPAALFMMITKTLLKANALTGLSPENILSSVNEIIYPDNDTSMFISVFCAILDTQTGEVRIGNAGHDPQLICRDGKNFEYMKLPRSFVLGPMEDSKFASAKLILKPNDVIFLYTDGVTEAMNPQKELFSKKRLQMTLSNLKDKDVTGIIQGVREEIEKFAQGAPQYDDITMLVLKFNG